MTLDDRHWTLTRSHPMSTTFDGPRLALGESVEVVPDDQLTAAVAAVNGLADLLYRVHPIIGNDGLADEVEAAVREARSRYPVVPKVSAREDKARRAT